MIDLNREHGVKSQKCNLLDREFKLREIGCFIAGLWKHLQNVELINGAQ